MATDPDGDRVGIAVRDRDGGYQLLNGNQTGSLLVYYLLKNLKEQDKLKGNEFIARTIVTTPLFSEIAEAFGVKTYEVLTGFKWIAELIHKKEQQEHFVGRGKSIRFMTGSLSEIKISYHCRSDRRNGCLGQRTEIIPIGSSRRDLRGIQPLPRTSDQYRQEGKSVRRRSKPYGTLSPSTPESLGWQRSRLLHGFQKQNILHLISHMR
jgi:phosphomannomutase